MAQDEAAFWSGQANVSNSENGIDALARHASEWFVEKYHSLARRASFCDRDQVCADSKIGLPWRSGMGKKIGREKSLPSYQVTSIDKPPAGSEHEEK